MSPFPIIEVEKVTFGYGGHPVLRDLSLEHRPAASMTVRTGATGRRPANLVPGLRFELTPVGRRSAAAIVAATVLSLVLQGRDVAVPLIPGDAVVRTSPLLPLLVAVPLVTTSANPMQVLEAMAAGRRLIRARFGWAAGMGAIAAALCAVAAWSGDPDGISAVGAGLNALCFVGLGLATAAVLGADLAWTGPCLLALCTFFFGKDLEDQTRSWAWLLHGPQQPGSWSTSIGILLLGAVLYTRFDSTGVLRRRAGLR